MADPTQEDPISGNKVRRQIEMELIKLGSYYGTASADQRLNITAGICLLNSALLIESPTRAAMLLSLARKNARIALAPKPRRVAPEKYIK